MMRDRSTPDGPDDGLWGVALAAVRWRAGRDDDAPSMVRSDRRWLLRYVDRIEGEYADALIIARKALEGHRVDGRSHGQYVAEDVFPMLDRLIGRGGRPS